MKESSESDENLTRSLTRNVLIELVLKANKENKELKLELQKQKELNAELVRFVQELLDDHKNHCFMLDFESKAESLIKKSSEI